MSEKYFSIIKKIKNPYENTIPVFNTSGKLIIALFEFRPIIEMKWVLNAVLNVYDSNDIGLAIVHGENNKDFVHENFGNWKNILLVNTHDKNHNSHSYSNRMITPELWENFINWSHVLVYQCDALILRKIEDIYFKYDYIGSPWSVNRLKHLAGNGGFSLRNVKSMIRVCGRFRNKNINEFTCPNIHEDGFFCRQKNMVYPSSYEREIHEQFAVESIYNENPIGLHKFYRWIKDEEKLDKIIENIKNKFLII